MPINLNLNLELLMHRFQQSVLMGIPEGLDAAAGLMKANILKAFAVGGPGWRPLSDITKKKKRKSKSPNPDAILREFNVMRDSIDIKDETAAIYPPAGKTIQFSDIGVNHIRCIGLFSDTAKQYDPNKEIDFRGPLDVVKRGMKHEFGGLELQTMKEHHPGIMEIRTKGLQQKALKGEGDVVESKYPKVGVKGNKTGKSTVSRVRKVLQKITKSKNKKLTQWVYIPERSFLRMPFDISEQSLMRRIIEGLRRRIDAAW